jgi:Uri superfamily endonuclease
MKGIYILITYLEKNSEIVIGRLGKLTLKKGFYLYVGSAMNSLEGRIKRHFSVKKKVYWHIDYLLKNAKPLYVVIIETEENLECTLAKKLKERFIEINRFGSSDCLCVSHLFYSEDDPSEVLNNIKGLKPLTLFQDLPSLSAPEE